MSTKPHPDLTQTIELVRRAQDGKRDALEELFARYYERIRRIVRMRIGKELRVTADSCDVLQETFIAAIRAFDRFEMVNEASFLHWLARIAERQVKDQVARGRTIKRDRRREVALQQIVDANESKRVALEPADDTRSASERLIDAEDIGTIEQCMDELRADYREVILLRNYENASWSQVAEHLKSPSANAARMLYARAMTELATALRRRGRGGGDVSGAARESS